MSEYAQQRWIDCRGDLHDTKEEALLGSRRHEIRARMKSTFVHGSNEERNNAVHALLWFLRDAENIIAVYEGICQLVDDQMQP